MCYTRLAQIKRLIQVANIAENIMDHTLRRINFVLDWIQVEGNGFGLDPNEKKKKSFIIG